MSEIIAFKPRKPPAIRSEDLPHYHSIICELSALTPQDRLSVIAASCDDGDWKELFELAVYSLGETLSEQALHRLVEKVVRQATRAAP
jgi:hypothetical protein